MYSIACSRSHLLVTGSRHDTCTFWLCVMLDGKQSALAFDGTQKSGKVELVPLAPEAVQLLEPLKQDSGRVFRLLSK